MIVSTVTSQPTVASRVRAGLRAGELRTGRHSIPGPRLSGLWHHWQLSGQPLKKTVVRIPGPSWMAYLLRSNIIPVDANFGAFPGSFRHGYKSFSPNI